MTLAKGIWSQPKLAGLHDESCTSAFPQLLFMKTQRSILPWFSAVALLLPQFLQAQTVATPDNGDILLGVRATGGAGAGVSLLVNVGDDVTFRNAASGSKISLANVGAELVAAYGANWHTRSDLNWSFFGARNQTNPVVYGTRVQSPVGRPSVAFPLQDLSQRTSTKNQIVSVLDTYSQLDQFSGNANAALQTNASNSGSYNYQVGLAGTTDFGSLSQWVSIEGDFGNGTTGTVLDFFRYAGTPSVPSSERLGSFEIDALGALTFTRSLPTGVSGIKLAQSSFSVNENSGVLPLVIRRTDDISTAVSATISTANGTATAGVHYTAQTNVNVSFAADEYEKTVNIPITDIAGVSADRDFTVTLASPSVGAQLVSPISASVAIVDTDSEVTFFTAGSLEVRALNESNEPNSVELVVNRIGNINNGAAVDVTLSGGSLTNGVHYTFTTPTTLTFAAGDATESVVIPLNLISPELLPGTIVLTLGNAVGVTLGTVTSTTVSILPSSGEINFVNAAETVNAVNAAGSPNLVTVNLARSGGTSGASSVNVSATGGTLTSGIHFVALANPQTVTFPNGSSSASFTLQLNAISAGLLASGATIELELSSPTNFATLGATTTSTLTVAGSPGTIAISAASYNVREERGVFNLPLVRSGGAAGVVSVSVSTSNGTAQAPADFIALSGQVVQFGDGVTAVNVPVVIKDTVAKENNETFTVTIGTPVGGATLGRTLTTVRILDQDTGAPKVTLQSPAANAKIAASQGTSVNVTGKVQDDKEVALVELKINGGNYVNVPFSDTKGDNRNVSFSIPVTAQRGTNIVVVRAFDHWGNVSELTSRNFIFDDPFGPLAGSYSGLITPSEDNPSSNSSNGLVGINVLNTGAFSGTLRMDGLSLGFNGVISNSGIARFGKSGDDNLLVERPNKPGYRLRFTLDISAGTGVKRIAGTVTEHLRQVVVGESQFTAERSGFNGKTLSVPASYLANKGGYTVVFPLQSEAGGLSVSDFPQGDGAGTATIKANGSVTIVATLADGTKLTASGSLWADLRLPFFSELYAKRGSIGGIIALNDGVADSDFAGDDLFWFRPFQNVQHYPYGWPEGLAAKIRGAKYNSATALTSLLSLGAEDPVAGNVLLGFTDGLLDESLDLAANISVAGKVSYPSNTGKTLSLKWDSKTGLFSGSFAHPDSTRPTYNGVIYQKGLQKGGYGHFLSTAPKVRDGTGEAGAVTLTKK
jgi:hypothetical protein